MTKLAIKILPETDPSAWKLDPSNTSQDAVYQLVGNLTNIALDIAGVVAMIYILIGAFNYLTAYGNEEKATNGKNSLTWAIIGLAIVILGKVLVAAIWRLVTPTAVPF